MSAAFNPGTERPATIKILQGSAATLLRCDACAPGVIEFLCVLYLKNRDQGLCLDTTTGHGPVEFLSCGISVEGSPGAAPIELRLRVPHERWKVPYDGEGFPSG
jgi:hypothetical protein